MFLWFVLGPRSGCDLVAFSILLKHPQTHLLSLLPSKSKSKQSFKSNAVAPETTEVTGKHASTPNLLDIRLEQLRFKRSQLGDAHSLHVLFEGREHFYYPQRLWIAFSVSIVGLVFVLVVYYFGLRQLSEFLDELRLDIMNFLAQSNSIVTAAPAFLEQMTKFNLPESLRSTTFPFVHLFTRQLVTLDRFF
jgi:hypothetical protein